MPLDPTLTNPIQFKMPDPLEQMGGALTNMLMMDKIQAARQERMDNALLNEAYKVAGGDKNKLYQAIIERGQGSQVPGLMKRLAEAEHKQAEVGKVAADTDKTNADAMKQALENTARVLPLVSQQDYAAVMSKDPIIGKQFQALGWDQNKLNAVVGMMTPEQFGQFRQQQMLGVKESLEKNYHLVSEEGKQILVAVNKFAEPNAQVAGTYGAKPKTEGTNITINGDKAANEFEKAVGSGRGKQFLELEDAARRSNKLVQDVSKIRGVLDKAFTGKAAGFATDVVAWAKALGFNVPNDRLVASQVLRRYLKDNIFNSIAQHKANGASLTPLSNLDLNLISDANMAQELDAASIRALLDDAERAARESVNQYNNFSTQMNTNPQTQPGSSAMSMGQVPQPPSGGWPAPQPGHIDHLRKTKDTVNFDRKFGPGAAARVLGGTPTGGTPFQ